MAPGPCLRDRRAAPRRPVEARRERTHGSTATRSTSSGASSRRFRRRTSTSWASGSSASSASRRPATPGTTCRISTRTARSTRATPQACASQAATFVMPPCPPPEFDLEAWESSLVEIERRAPARLALIHFGAVDDVQEHLASLRATLGALGEPRRGRDGRADVHRRGALTTSSRSDPELVDEYQRAGPYWHHFRGIERYWRKRRRGSQHLDRLVGIRRLRFGSGTGSPGSGIGSGGTGIGSGLGLGGGRDRCESRHGASPLRPADAKPTRREAGS